MSSVARVPCSLPVPVLEGRRGGAEVWVWVRRAPCLASAVEPPAVQWPGLALTFRRLYSPVGPSL